MSVEIVARNQVIIAKIFGDLDHHSAKEMRHDIDKAINARPPKLLILDFSEVTFMDSSGIGLIMGRYKIMNEYDGEVIVACPPPYIRRVLQISGIHRLAKIVPDYSAILKAYHAEKEEKFKEAEKIEAKNN